MSGKYKLVPPQLSKDEFLQHDNVPFVFTLPDGEAFDPTKYQMAIMGEMVVYQNGTTVPTNGQTVYRDNYAGAGVCFRNVQDSVGNVMEAFNNYDRFVKMYNLATIPRSELGLGIHAPELTAPSKDASAALSQGRAGTRAGWIPFSHTLKCMINTANGPITNKHGEIRVRLTLAPNADVLSGEDVDAGSSYRLRNLYLCYVAVPAPAKAEPLTCFSYIGADNTIDSGDFNWTAKVPRAVDKMHLSFISNADEEAIAQNHQLCSPVPGIPPRGSDGSSDSSYGLERFSIGLNDVETAFMGFELDSREEIIRNAIRSFNNGNTKAAYSTLIRHMNDADGRDGYLVGLDFGLPILSDGKINLRLESQCSNANKFHAYAFFRTVDEIAVFA